MEPLRVDPPLDLTPHHAASVANLRDRLSADPTVVALLLTGSLAHGFASSTSDVDYLAVVADDEHRRRAETGSLTEAGVEGITYPGGYTDGKYVTVGFLRAVAERGSEPARFAFADARFLVERDPQVRPLLAEIVRYPEAGVDDRIERFAAQLLAWQWYCAEGQAKENRYLTMLATQKLVLFSCRLVLAVNRTLYPYHKWLLRVTEAAPRRPATLLADLDRLLTDPEPFFVDAHVRTLVELAELDHGALALSWGGHFLRDNELTWMDHEPPVDDL